MKLDTGARNYGFQASFHTWMCVEEPFDSTDNTMRGVRAETFAAIKGAFAETLKLLRSGASFQQVAECMMLLVAWHRWRWRWRWCRRWRW